MDELVNTTKCPNCGYVPFESLFCSECGQKRLSKKDYSLLGLLKDFIDGVVSLDNNFLNTFKLFLLKPKKYAKEYITGARKKYISPIKFYILSNTVYFFFPAVNTFTTPLDIQLNNLPYSKLIDGLVNKVIISSGLDFEAFASEYNALTQVLSKALLIVIPLLLSVFTFTLDSKKRNRAPFVSHFNYSLVLGSFHLLILSAALPWIYTGLGILLNFETILSDGLLTSIAFILINIYGYVLYRGFFEGGNSIKVFRVILLNILFLVIIYIYRLILLFTTLGWIIVF